MTVENATDIATLDPQNPPGTDPLSEGDDHERLIKSVLQAVISQSDAEDSANTSPYIWSPERVSQAVAAYLGNVKAYSFAGSMANPQVVSVGVTAVMQLDTIDWDQANWWADNKYTPQEAGIFHCIGAVKYTASGGGIQVHIQKNGSKIASFDNDDKQVVTSTLVFCDGVSDYLELAATNLGASSRTFGQDVTGNYFHIAKVSDYVPT